MRTTFLVTRLVVVVAIVTAVLAQLVASLTYGGPQGNVDRPALVVNFFSYFTIDSNLLSVVVLVLGAVTLARGSLPESRTLTIARVTVTSYMIVTGVVYNVLLRGVLVQGSVVAWSNEVLHVVAPAYVALDWFLAPGRHRLVARDAVPALIFPAVWVVYTLVRGPFARDPFGSGARWYPYPFLNPVTSAGGYLSVAAYVVVIAVVFVLLALGLTRTTRRGKN